MTTMTKNGVSTTTSRDQFQCEEFYSDILKRTLFQWDYRDENGKLHSGVAKSLDAAGAAAAKFGYTG